MNTKILEDILLQVYELGVQQTDCDLTKKANTIMMLTNQRVTEELEEIISRLEKKSFTAHSIEEVDRRIKELKDQESLKQD
jgi:hypothetical protein